MSEQVKPNDFEIKYHPESEIVIIGSGPIGEKAQNLLDFTPIAREVGFATPERTIIAQDVIESWIGQATGVTSIGDLSPEQGRGLLVDARLTKLIENFFPRLHFRDDTFAVVARSSGPSDRRGIGVYESVPSFFKDNLLAKAILKVIASYSTERAVAHRKKMGNTHGYGLIVEPLVHNAFFMSDDHSGVYVAPPVSGYGQTRTPDEYRGYIAAVPGLGGGVDSQDAHIFRPDDYRLPGGSMVLALFFERLDIENGKRPKRETDLLQNRRPFNWPHIHWGKAFRVSDGGGNSDGTVIEDVPLIYDSRVEEGLKEINMGDLERMAKKLADGKRLYYEWAATIDDGVPHYWLLQAGELDEPIDNVDFSQTEGLFSEGVAVVGTGERVARKAVFLRNDDDYERFVASGFNDRFPGYCVFISSELTEGSAGIPKDLSGLTNAVGIFEWSDARFRHRLPIKGHIGGLLEEYDIALGVIGREPKLDVVDVDGIKTYPGDILIRSSQGRQKVTLHKIDSTIEE